MIALPAPRRAAGLLLALLPAAAATRLLPEAAQAWLLVAMAAALGLPHGAADWWLAAAALPQRLPPALRPAWPAVFGGLYLMAMACVLALFAVAPGAVLLAFVAFSAWHFGEWDARWPAPAASPVEAACAGILPIAAPALLWPHTVSAILAGLGVVLMPDACLTAGGGGVALGLLSAVRAGAPALIRQHLAMLALAAAAPPLAAFAVYFGFVHAPRQAARLGVAGDPRIVWAAAIAAAAMAVGLLPILAARAPALSAATPPPLLFLGLAVLTFPHVMCGILLSPRAGQAPAPASRILPA